ncbi:hypothetical protein M9H77_32612 [Catharanthus roseus]|uniref:Uncharacterized protein n=1 Tax=Catharanthus roseus TaxID=4058 RepID=A0ACC0A4V3_CATRO|nr:hypothetical protein M9H77_32612 [Catharanthus roseus]
MSSSSGPEFSRFFFLNQNFQINDAVAFAASRATQNLVHCQKLLLVCGVPGSHSRTGTGLWHWRLQRERKDEQRQRPRQELWRPQSEERHQASRATVSTVTHETPPAQKIRGGSPSLLLSLKTHLQEEPASQVPLFNTVSSDNKLNYDFGEIPGVQLAANGRNTASRRPRQDNLVQSTAIVQNDHLSRHKKVQQIETHQTIPSPLAEDQHMALELGPREEWPGPRGSQLGQSLGNTNSQQETSSQPKTVNIDGNFGLTHIDSSSSNHNYSSDSSASSEIGQQNVVEPINLRRSNRQYRLPGKLKDYICNTLKLLGNYVIIRTGIVGLLVN